MCRFGHSPEPSALKLPKIVRRDALRQEVGCTADKPACACIPYPFTAPMVIPWVKYRWNRMNTTRMGTAATAAPAMIRP